MSELVQVHAGLVPYDEAWAEQRRAARRPGGRRGARHRAAARAPAGLHRRQAHRAEERPTDGTPVIDVDRGGKITWHGPGQLVGYPIVRLPDPVDVVAPRPAGRGGADPRLRRPRGRGDAGSTGAAASGSRATDGGPDRKVAAIGIRVSAGVTMHGFALNCDCDLTLVRPHRAVRASPTPA